MNRASQALRAPIALLSLVLGIVLVSLGPAFAGAEAGVRLVTARILVDGEVVLQGSTSDDGDPDADAVWAYLHRLDLRPTEAFGSLAIEPGSDEVTLGWLRSKDNAHLGKPPTLGLEIEYGGEDAPFLLGLVRSEGGHWRVAPETVERRFSYRRITRSQAADLDEPKRTGTR